MRKKLIGLVMTIVLLAGVVGCGQTGDIEKAEASEAPVVINIGVTPYPHAEVIASVLQVAYEELGYETERVEGDVGFMFVGLSQHDIDVYVDGWLPVLQKTFVDKYEDKIEILDPYYENADIGFAVPSYMEDINTIQDLVDHADLFKNKLIGIEPGTGMMETTEKTLVAYDAVDDFDVLPSSTPAMLGEVESETRAGEPIVFLGWRPHVMFSKYDIKMLEDEKGVWSYDNVHPIASTLFKEKAPKAYEFANKFTISIDQLEGILYQAETTDANVDEATKEWFADHRDVLDAVLAE